MKFQFKSSLIQNVSWIFIASAISNFLRFFLVFVLLRMYSAEEFGLWASITSIAAILVTGDFGITNVLRYKASYALENNRINEFQTQFFSSLYFFLLLAIVLSIILVIASPYIPYEKLFKTSNVDLMNQGRTIFIVIQIFFLFGIPFSLGSSMFFPFNETRQYSIMLFLQGIITFFAVVVLGFFHCKISTLSIVFFAINTLGCFCGTLYFLHKRKWKFPYITFGVMFSNIKTMLPSGVKFLTVQLSSSFVFNVITLYSGAMLGLAVAANVNVIQKVYTFFASLYQSINNPIWSSIAKNFFSNNLNKCKEILYKSCFVTVVLFLAIILVTYLFKDMIIRIVAGSEYEANGVLFVLIGVFYLAKALFENVTLLQNATNHLNKLVGGYLLFDVFVAFVIPFIMAHFGLYIMIFCMIVLWFSFIGFMIFENISILSRK